MKKTALKPNVLIVGAGSVAHVAAHKCAENNDVLGDICIASRTRAKCDAIIESIKRKRTLKDVAGKLSTRKIDAMDIGAMVRLIKATRSSIVINVGTSYINMSVLEACIRAKVAYIDTALHEEQDKICEAPPWYANHEWRRRERCKKAGVSAILSVGFDPGVVNAYAALAREHCFDTIDSIDIMDVNAGSHGRYFATNFDPEINLRELLDTWSWIDGKWVETAPHTENITYDMPALGCQKLYLTGHEEIHSLSENLDVPTIRFWMGFGDHYLKVFDVLKNIGMLSEKPVRTREGIEVVPLKVLKAVLPEPSSLAKDYTGLTCIGTLVKGIRDGERREVFIYNVCDHEKSYKEVESQAISYTAGVPPVAAAILLAESVWNPKTMVNVEELDPRPFIDLLGGMGLPTNIEDRTPKRSRSAQDYAIELRPIYDGGTWVRNTKG